MHLKSGYIVSFYRLPLINQFIINPRLPERGMVTIPLRLISRPAKTLKATMLWLQLFVGSSFSIILMQTILLPYPGVGIG